MGQAQLNGLQDYGSDAQTRDGLLDAGITQTGESAKVEAGRMTSSQSISDSLNNTPLGTKPATFQNPLQIGATPSPAAAQPDYRVPSTPGVTVMVEAPRNPLGVSGPLVPFVQPGVAAPPPPVAGQLSTMSYGSIGTSKITHADGSTSST
jgi:hypothetical protein